MITMLVIEGKWEENPPSKKIHTVKTKILDHNIKKKGKTKQYRQNLISERSTSTAPQ